MVIVEALKSRLHQGKRSNLYFYRDSKGNEVDLLFAGGQETAKLIFCATGIDTDVIASVWGPVAKKIRSASVFAYLTFAMQTSDSCNCTFFS